MNRNYYYFLLLIVCINSCTKEDKLDKGLSDFNVNTERSTYKVGENVKFAFKGNPNIITFFSGELFNNYEYKNERIVKASGAVNFSFRSNVTGGTQLDQFKVLVSNDFNGDYEDFSKFESSEWTDITSRFSLATSTSFTDSKIKDISDLITSLDKPLYIAFRYITYPQIENGIMRTYGVQSILLNSDTPFHFNIRNMNTLGFRIIEKNPINPSKSTIAATTLTLRGNTPVNDNYPFTDTWFVSDPINLSSLNLGPDRPIAVKDISKSRLDEFIYAYSTPGVYKARFIAINSNSEKREEVLREITINIIEADTK